MTRWLAVITLAVSAAASAAAQTPAAPNAGAELEYRVKAAYLFNFTKFVEWPNPADKSPLSICVAAVNPFGTALADIVSDEQVNGRPLQARVVRQATGCHVLFIPRGVPHGDFVPRTGKSGVLTVGESPRFLTDGGIINFVIEDGKVRFEIDQDAAARANLAISSRLLRLARRVVSESRDDEWAR